MAKKTIRAKGLNGEAGLLAAIIDQAVNDATGAAGPQEAIDALSYLNGDLYRHHITALDCDPDRIPAALKDEATLIRVIDLVLRDKYHGRTKEYHYQYTLD